jgi:2-hydroxy-3-oxopropionate reductase
MSSVAFIGLGIMGAPMADNLLAAGHDVVAFTRTARKLSGFVERGGRAATSVADAVRDAEVVITMLPDSPDVEDVVLGPDGVLAHLRVGGLLIDCSTILPEVSSAIAATAHARSILAVDAPVSGGERGAIDGTLSIMVGGSDAAFEAALPVLETVGKTIVHVGEAGAGQIVKAANQLIVAGNLQLVAEAIVFLEAHGVETEAALRVLGGGLAGSTVIERKGAAMLARNYTPGFRLELHHKDLGIMTAAARSAGVVTPLGAGVAQLVAAAVARGDGGLDHGALLKLTEELSGRDGLAED